MDCACLTTRKNAKLRVINGQCRNCSNDRLKGSRNCLYHFVKRIVDLNKMPNRQLITEHLLDKLYQQKFECWYTGVLLIPGMNASLDHILAKDNKGDNSVDNLIWVDFSINKVKMNTPVNRFLVESEDMLAEFNLLHSIDGFKNNRQKLNYVLGNNFALNQVIA